MTLRGRVENGVVVLQNGAELADGTLVEVTPLQAEAAVPAPAIVSEERRAASLALIGICKTDNPPDDEEVERIVEEAIMKKYG